MNTFAEWLSGTPASAFLQRNNAWAIPAIQSIHIIGIGALLASALMVQLRILGWAWTDQSLRQTMNRFGPWLTGSLYLLLGTGVLLVIGEPVRELVTLSFWMKMFLVGLVTVVAVSFRSSLRRRESEWEEGRTKRPAIRLITVLTMLLWACIIVLGRLIAYDHVWGTWSPATKA